MRKSRFTEEQIALALRQVDAGVPVTEIIGQITELPSPWRRLRPWLGLGLATLLSLPVLVSQPGTIDGSPSGAMLVGFWSRS